MPVGNPVTTWGFNQPKMLSTKVNKHWDLILTTKMEQPVLYCNTPPTYGPRRGKNKFRGGDMQCFCKMMFALEMMAISRFHGNFCPAARWADQRF